MNILYLFVENILCKREMEVHLSWLKTRKMKTKTKIEITKE